MSTTHYTANESPHGMFLESPHGVRDTEVARISNFWCLGSHAAGSVRWVTQYDEIDDVWSNVGTPPETMAAAKRYFDSGGLQDFDALLGLGPSLEVRLYRWTGASHSEIAVFTPGSLVNAEGGGMALGLGRTRDREALYIAGKFEQVGDDPAFLVAEYDPVTGVIQDAGDNLAAAGADTKMAAIVDNNRVVAGAGTFGFSDTADVFNAGLWDDGTARWYPIARGLSPPSSQGLAIAYYASGLEQSEGFIVGGSFEGGIADDSSLVEKHNIIRFVRTTRTTAEWKPFLSTLASANDRQGLNGPVTALHNATYDRAILIVGGTFTTTRDAVLALPGIAIWNGLFWSSLGGVGPDDGTVHGITTDIDRNIYITGSFTSVGGDTSLARVAKYNPTTGWSPLGGGFQSGEGRYIRYDRE